MTTIRTFAVFCDMLNGGGLKELGHFIYATERQAQAEVKELLGRGNRAYYKPVTINQSDAAYEEAQADLYLFS